MADHITLSHPCQWMRQGRSGKPEPRCQL
jgi:hypothetical protein